MEEGDLEVVASKVDRLHLKKTKLSGSTRRKPDARVRQGGTRYVQQPRRAITPKPK
jgi:hypothetical protein